jgi:magnesium chelatase family protein
MSLSLVHSRALLGLEARPVSVEVHLANGLPSFTLVGLAETAVKEARERVRSAIQNTGLDFPANKRITVNLAPADLPKDSGRFDLPIALGILAASGQIDARKLEGYEFAGELSLGGDLRPVRGALAMSLALARTERLPPQARCPSWCCPRPAPRRRPWFPAPRSSGRSTCSTSSGSFCRETPPVEGAGRLVAGQARSCAARAVGLPGPGRRERPGCGPARAGNCSGRRPQRADGGRARLRQIHAGPALCRPAAGHDHEEALESAAVASLGGRFSLDKWAQRPTCAPHHTASAVALVGGGSPPRPGEISLAHRGVLFLDELPEFPRAALEALREPLESGCITISRAAQRAEFPARFQLVAAMNPCPCGYLGSSLRACRCSPDQVSRYQGKLSGPLLDRIDLHVEVGALAADELVNAPPGEATADIRLRVVAARDRALARQGGSNQALEGQAIDAQCQLDDAAAKFLNTAAARLGWSGRSIHRCLKVARTIADLAGAQAVQTVHVAEAVQYRRALKAGYGEGGR